MADLTVRRLAAPEARALEMMTFPAYRHLLSLEPTVRHPGQGQQRQVQAVALAAMRGPTAVGLLVAETPTDRSARPEVLSVFVPGPERNQGVATALIGALERELAVDGWPAVDAVYMTGKAGIDAMERVLEKQEWSAPVTRSITVKFTPQEAATAPWFNRVRLRDADFEIFPWTELRPEEATGIRESHEQSPWIDEGLEPWKHDVYGFDAVSSLGLRYRGTTVGWVINHRIGPEYVRFTCSFMRRDLGRRGRILPLYTESIRRLVDDGCTLCTLVTPLKYAAMAEFLRRRCQNAVHFFGETRGSTRELGASAS